LKLIIQIPCYNEAETLRQCMDKVAEAVRPIVICTVELLKRAKAVLSTLPSGHMPLDLDVFTQNNSNTKKEGVSWTYRKFNGCPHRSLS
jgi:hypothetical protein